MEKEPEEVTVAHAEGRGVMLVDSKGIKRETSLYRFGDRVQLEWRTWWNGPEEAPVVNAVLLSMPALNAAMELIADFAMNPDRYPDNAKLLPK